jgi:dTDP-glucose pyrophosphorylase
MNIIIPMAGNGQRFIDAGYKEDKPFVKIFNKPMFRIAIENLNISGHYYLLVKLKHMQRILSQLKFLPQDSQYTVIPIKKRVNGSTAACLTLCETIMPNEPLIVANCDQIIDWNSVDFLKFCELCTAEGVVTTFKANSAQHSYARENEDGQVIEIKEKQVISNDALCGVHFWNRADMAFWSFQKALEGPPHYNGEYYIAPTYNEIIKLDGLVLQYKTNGMVVLGTPHQLEEYISENSRTT